MKTMMLGFLAETPIHCGSGRSSGVIDLPVAREAATDYPFVPGSSLKGALSDRADERGLSNRGALFGEPSKAGRLLVSDARLLLLPVRSLAGAYRWVTCPLVLERYRRDLARLGAPVEIGDAPALASGEAPTALASGVPEGKLYLEERELTVTGPCPAEWSRELELLVRHDDTRKRLPGQVAIVGNDEFAWFCRYSIPVQARNVLDENKVSKNLWHEESLPPDTLLYTLLMSRDEGACDEVLDLFPAGDPYLQIGGNETVGHGWVAVASRRGGKAP